MASDSTGSVAAAASRRRSKPGTRSSVAGSRTANSSSSPTVPSWDAAKTSGTAAVSIT